MSEHPPRERWDEQLALGRWLEAIASPQPLPAGGRVASIAGALAAALVEKIARIVLRSPKRTALHPAAEVVAARAASLRPQLLAVGEADDRAYAAVMTARRAGPTASVSLHDAEVSAARWQLTLIRNCVEVIELAQQLGVEVGPALGADVATAGFLARAAAEAAHGNIIVDLKGLEADSRAVALSAGAAAALARVPRAAESGGPQR